MLLAALEDRLEKDAETVPGQLFVFEQRIFVTSGIGIVLTIILLISSGCIAFVAYTTSLSRRALNLVQDPGTIHAASLLISGNGVVRTTFLHTDRSSQQAVAQRIGKEKFVILNGVLLSIDKGDDVYQEGKTLFASCLQRI